MKNTIDTYFKQAGSSYKTRIRSIGKYGIVVAFIVLCIGLSVITPRFLTVSNLMIILTQVSINALLAFGVTFVIITGGIDLSIGSMVPNH